MSKHHIERYGRNSHQRRSIRRRVVERDDWICQLCFAPIDPEAPEVDDYSLTLDHIVEAADGGRKRKVARVARTHARVRAIRSDFLHRTSHRLATSYVAIGVESLNVAGMVRNRRLSRAISDLGWGEFLRQLAYKTQWSGSTLVEAGRFCPSTKMCSGCGASVDVPLSQRTYVCAACGLILDRDLNSARNLCPVAVTPTETINASGGNVSPGSAWQIPLTRSPALAVSRRRRGEPVLDLTKLEPSTQTLAA